MFSFSLLSGLSFVRVEEQVRDVLGEGKQNDDQRLVCRKILSLLDFTSLEGSDNAAKIELLCRKALSFGEKDLPYPAAVCIYPPFVSQARRLLQGSPIKVATTAGAFPGGQMSLAVKLEEIRYAIREGADEIDLVISRGTFLEEKYHVVFRELDVVRELCKGLTLKVILETGELKSPENIAKASEIAIEAGADFIKTSTGKILPAATEEAMYTMLLVIREYHRKTGKKVGIKPAGGIVEPEKAMRYYRLVEEILGKEWLSPDLFRIGASRLADNLVNILIQP